MSDCTQVNLNTTTEPSVTLNAVVAPLVNINYPTNPSVNLNNVSYPSVNISTNPPLNLGFYVPPFFPVGGGGGQGNSNIQVTGSNYLTVANFTGIGGAVVTISGGYIVISGAIPSGGILTGNYDPLGTAANTGQILYTLITGLSGEINSLSGFVTGMSGYLASHSTGSNSLQVTGSNPVAMPNFTGIAGINVFLSGNFVIVSGATGNFLTGNYDPLGTAQATGIILENQINSLSGFTTGLSGYDSSTYSTITNLGLTGQSLYNNLTGLSGQFNTNFATNSTVNSLSGFTTGISGFGNLTYSTITNLTQTGITIENQLNSLSGFVTGLSGFSNSNYGTINNLFLTGSGLYFYITGFSGQINNALTNTGIITESQINSLSGFTIGISGYLTTHLSGSSGVGIQITGSSSLTVVNFTGIGGTIIFTSGNYIFISGASGNIGGLYDPSGTAANTGQILYNLITGLSGQSNTNFATISNLTQTGILIENQINSLSGFVTGLSGFGANIYATITNLNLTGSNLYTDLTGLSGQFNINFATNSNLTQTGIILENQINSLSGFVTGLSGFENNTYSTINNLFLTGNILYQNLTGLSGQINTTITNTGIIVENQINSLSGFITGISGYLSTHLTGSSGSNIQITGSNLLTNANFTGIGGLLIFTSGNFVIISGGSATVSGSSSNLYSLLNSGLPFDIKYNIPVPQNVENQYVAFTTGFGMNPMVLFNVVNNSGDPILGNVLSGISKTGFNVVFSSPTPTANYLINYIATTGSGINLLGSSYALVYTGAYIEFDFRLNIPLSKNIESQSISFSAPFVNAPYLIYSITNNSGDPILGSYLSGINTSGFNVIFSAAPSTTNYTLNYIATTGSGINFLGAGGGGTSSIQITGSYVTNPNFTGIGGTYIFTSGNFIFISGATGSAGGSFDPLGTAASTGQILYTDLTGLSGQFNTNFAPAANLTQTGIVIELQINSLSGFVTGLSGFENNTYSTINNLFLTGSNLYIDIIGLSGTNNTLINSLSGFVTGLSGFENVTYATITNLYTSGSNLYITLTGLSGTQNLIIQNTGNVLYQDIIGLSGYLTGNPVINNLLINSGITISGNAKIFGNFIYPSVLYTGTGILFNFGSNTGLYIWSGAGTGISGSLPTGILATGLLPTGISGSFLSGVYSGYNFEIKNKSQSGWLLISGNIENQQNFIIYPLSAYIFYNDNQTWNIL